MSKKSLLAFAIAAAASLWSVAGHAETVLKPFILSSMSGSDPAAVLTEVKTKLTNGGFEIVGEYAPYAGTTLVVATNDALRAHAAQSEFGGYGAAERVSVSMVDGAVQVAYANPPYWAAAYRMKGDLSDIAEQLKTALGAAGEFGSKDGLTAKELRGYHYMFGMEYFTDPSELVEYDSFDAAIAAVEKGLAEKAGGVSKVYRVDVPGKDEAVFGVAMRDPDMLNDAAIMSKIDFGKVKSAAHLPYEMLVSGKTVYALYARFRIAVSFPDLSMMGSNSFMSIMECPGQIEDALTLAAGGTVKKPAPDSSQDQRD